MEVVGGCEVGWECEWKKKRERERVQVEEVEEEEEVEEVEEEKKNSIGGGSCDFAESSLPHRCTRIADSTLSLAQNRKRGLSRDCRAREQESARYARRDRRGAEVGCGSRANRRRPRSDDDARFWVVIGVQAPLSPALWLDFSRAGRRGDRGRSHATIAGDRSRAGGRERGEGEESKERRRERWAFQRSGGGRSRGFFVFLFLSRRSLPFSPLLSPPANESRRSPLHQGPRKQNRKRAKRTSRHGCWFFSFSLIEELRTFFFVDRK